MRDSDCKALTGKIFWIKLSLKGGGGWHMKVQHLTVVLHKIRMIILLASKYPQLVNKCDR